MGCNCKKRSKKFSEEIQAKRKAIAEKRNKTIADSLEEELAQLTPRERRVKERQIRVKKRSERIIRRQARAERIAKRNAVKQAHREALEKRQKNGLDEDTSV